MQTGAATLRGVRRGLDAFAARASRLLSARAQTRLEVVLSGIEESNASGLAARLAPFECSVVLEVDGGGGAAFVVPSRGLAFALLALRFGARPGSLDAAPPERPCTRIEERALERTAAELWEAFRSGAGGLLADSAQVAGVESAARLREREDAPLWVARFAVTGLAQEEQLTLAVPRAPAASDGPASGRRSVDAG